MAIRLEIPYFELLRPWPHLPLVVFPTLQRWRKWTRGRTNWHTSAAARGNQIKPAWNSMFIGFEDARSQIVWLERPWKACSFQDWSHYVRFCSEHCVVILQITSEFRWRVNPPIQKFHSMQRQLGNHRELWSILKHFEAFWSILKHFEAFWSILKHFEAFWSTLYARLEAFEVTRLQ